MKDYWVQQAEKFEADFILRTGLGPHKKGPRETVAVFQKLTGLVVDRQAGAKTFGMLRRMFPQIRPVVRNDKHSDAPLCSWDDAVFPLEFVPGSEWRETSGNGRTGPNHRRPNHGASDYCRPMRKGRGAAKYPTHDGYWGAAVGDKILAVLPGVVVDIREPSDREDRYWMLVLRHNVGGVTWHSVYVHNNKHHALVGDTVQAGQHVADVGHTNTTLNHLHFSMHDSRLSDLQFVAITESFSKHWRWQKATQVNVGAKNTGMADGDYADKWPRVAALAL